MIEYKPVHNFVDTVEECLRRTNIASSLNLDIPNYFYTCGIYELKLYCWEQSKLK